MKELILKDEAIKIITSVALSKALGIISGDDFGNLDSDKNLTRAQAVVMALNLINANIFYIVTKGLQIYCFSIIMVV